MDTLLYLLELPIVDRLGWTLLHFLWQGTLIWLLCLLVLKTSLGRKPQSAYRVCILGLTLCAVCPVLTFLSVEPLKIEPSSVEAAEPSVAESTKPKAHAQPFFASESTFVPEASHSTTPEHPAKKTPWGETLGIWVAPYLPWLVFVWFAGASLSSTRLLCNWIEVKGFIRRARKPVNSGWIEKLQQLCPSMGIEKAVRLIESSELSVPIVVGALRPAILVPVGFLTRMEPAMVEAILLHELAHIRRHDYVVNLLQAVLRALFFYHPAVWWLDRMTCQVREFCCDDMAAKAIQDPQLYARALEGLAQKQSAHGLAPAANDGSLVSRIRVILGLGTVSVPSYRHLAGGSLLLIMAIGLTSSLHFSSALELDQSTDPLQTLEGISGRVVNAEGAPLPDTEVALYHLKYYYGLDNGVIETTRTDAKGRFQLTSRIEFYRDGRDTTRDAYAIVAWNETQALDWHPLNNQNTLSGEIELQLTDPVPRTIRVLDAEGRGVAGAEVFVHNLGGRKNSSLFAGGFGPLIEKTDSDGVALFSRLPAEEVNFAAIKAGYADSWTGCGYVQTEAEIRLSPAGVVEGRVVDENGAPIPAILIRAEPKWSLHDYNYARTDAAGRFRLDHLYGEGGCWTDDGGSGRYRIGLENDDYQAVAFEVHLQPGTVSDGHVITATSATKVSVTVLDPETEAAVPFAQISVHTPSGKYETESDANGRFKLSTPPGKVNITFWEPPKDTYVIDGMIDRERPHSINREVGEEDQEWTLYAPSAVSKFATVQGRVLWPDGSPAEGVTLTATLTKRHGQIVTQTRRNDDLNTIQSDADGYFTFEDYPLNHTLTCLLRHEEKSLEAMIDLPAVDANGTDIGEVTLAKTISRQLEIVDFDGNPVKNTAIDYGPYTDPDLTRARSVPTVSRNRLYRLKTDDDGKIELRSCLPNHAYDLWVADERTTWKRILPEDMASEQPLRITLDTRLRISIQDLTGQSLQVTETTHNGFSERDLNNQWNAVPILEQLTGGDFIISKESFKFTGPHSDIGLWARTPDGAVLHAKGSFPGRGSRVSLIAENIFKPRAEILPPNGNIVGTDDIAFYVTDAQGNPLSGVAVVSDPLAGHREERLEGETDADGWCIFKAVTERIIYCEFTKPGYATQWVADVAKGRSIPVILSNQTRLRGQLQTAEGGDAGVVQLRFEASRVKQWPDGRVNTVDEIPFIQETDAQGRYDFLIEPGTYRMTAENPSDGQLVIEKFNCPDGKTTALPDQLQPHVTTTLRVIDSLTKQPAEGITISVREKRSPYHVGRRKGSERVTNAEGIATWDDLLPGHVTFVSDSFRSYPNIPPAAYCRWWSLQHAYEFARENAERFMQSPPRGRDGVYEMTFELSTEDNQFEIMAERGIHVSGVVELPDELPDGSVYVTLVPVRGERTSLTGDSRDDISVNKEDGHFAAWMPAGNGLTYRASAYFRAKEYQNPQGFLPATVSEPFESKPGDQFTFNLSMQGGGWLIGQVNDEAGNPIADVEVQAIPTDHMTGIDAEPYIRTDEKGTYRIGPIRATEYEVRVDRSVGVNIDREAEVKTYVRVKDGKEATVDDLIIK